METFLPPSSEWLNLQSTSTVPATSYSPSLLPHASLPRYALQQPPASTLKRKAPPPVNATTPVEEFVGKAVQPVPKVVVVVDSLAERAAKSASSWNSSLLYARKQRGPQWDYGTRMYHVGTGSAEYYAGGVPLPPSSKTTQKVGTTAGAFNTGSSASGGLTAPTTAGNYDSGRPRRSKAATGNR